MTGVLYCIIVIALAIALLMS